MGVVVERTREGTHTVRIIIARDFLQFVKLTIITRTKRLRRISKIYKYIPRTSDQLRRKLQ